MTRVLSLKVTVKADNTKLPPKQFDAEMIKRLPTLESWITAEVRKTVSAYNKAMGKDADVYFDVEVTQ